MFKEYKFIAMKNALRRLHYWMVGKGDEQRLPQQVVDSIHRQQDASEILIGWMQFALVATFATLYALSPKTGAQAGFQPVPWAISLYFLFTVVRLFAAYNNYLPDWLLISSVVMDTALLMFLIWSFHIQYEQPASFYLKAPTVMYVFIFIALRTLRFEPRYIVWAGVTAILGWVFMVGYVVFSEAGNPMIKIGRAHV